MSGTVDTIKLVVCNDYNISMGDMDSECRASSLARPRQLAMYLARTMTSASFPDIGRSFNKDHTTIMHGVKNIQRHLDNDPILRDRTTRLIEQIGFKDVEVTTREAAKALAQTVGSAVGLALLKMAEDDPQALTDAVNKLLKSISELKK